jgi:pyrimidine-nucleoside phosphorylase
MSKKMAEGIEALVLDVKTGSGAFMKQRADAEYLAQLMVETGKRMGKKIVALLTDMSQPLGRKVGNALEVIECLEILNGEGPQDLRELCDELSAWMLLLGGRVETLADGRSLAAEMIESGKALESFREIIRLQGGDPGVIDDPGRLPAAKNTESVRASRTGYVTNIQCEQIGIASMMIGGGREKVSDKIDHGVGLVLERKLGDSVAAGEAFCTIHYNSDARLSECMELLEESFEIGSKAPLVPPLVLKTLGGEAYSNETVR